MYELPYILLMLKIDSDLQHSMAKHCIFSIVPIPRSRLTRKSQLAFSSGTTATARPALASGWRVQVGKKIAWGWTAHSLTTLAQARRGPLTSAKTDRDVCIYVHVDDAQVWIASPDESAMRICWDVFQLAGLPGPFILYLPPIPHPSTVGCLHGMLHRWQ